MSSRIEAVAQNIYLYTRYKLNLSIDYSCIGLARDHDVTSLQTDYNRLSAIGLKRTDQAGGAIGEGEEKEEEGEGGAREVSSSTSKSFPSE